MFPKLSKKYRVIVISIALFLVFDLGVLVLNFYTSGKIAQSTERVNLAGQQRTLSQQMSKQTLYIQVQKHKRWPYITGLRGLQEHRDQFSETMQILNEGGTVVSSETGQEIYIPPLYDPKGQATLQKGNKLWQDFDKAIQPIIVDGLVTDDEIKPATEYIAKNNLALYGAMDELTDYFTDQAVKQTNFLRMAQVAGISLATINFFIILFHFLKQLRRGDAKLEVARNESEQILSSINEGVFLIKQDLTISSQYSSYLEKVFQTDNIAGRYVVDFLGQYLSTRSLDTACEYIGLFFKDHIDNDLIADVNPLKNVKVNIFDEHSQANERFLDFSFTSLLDTQQDAILVTVKDVTDSILLAKQQENSAQKMDDQFALFSQILPIASNELKHFISDCREGLEKINAQLKSSKKKDVNFEQTLANIMVQTHKLKGNAYALEFEWIGDRLHEFENRVDSLSVQGKKQLLSGQDLVPLVIDLRKLKEQINQVDSLYAKLVQFGFATQQRQNINSVTETEVDTPRVSQALDSNRHERWLSLPNKAKQLAAQEGKQLDLVMQGLNWLGSNEMSNTLYAMTLQMIANSVAHGIEIPKDRVAAHKPSAAVVKLSLMRAEGRGYRFVYQDDGRGFDFDKIRTKLLNQADMSAEKLNAMSQDELIAAVFRKQISTFDTTTKLAGRGVGSKLILEQVKQLNGKLTVNTLKGKYTRFVVDFPFEQQDKKKVA